MPRLPYVTDEQAGDTPLVAAIRKRRGGGLLNLDRQLLHSPPFAQGWGALLGAVRTQLSIDPRLREMAMCAVAVLNDTDYEFVQHGPEFIKAGGTAIQLDAIAKMASTEVDRTLFDPLENAVLDLSTQMTRTVAVDDAVFTALRTRLDDTKLVELVGVVAAYNMVTRFLVALGIEPE